MIILNDLILNIWNFAMSYKRKLNLIYGKVSFQMSMFGFSPP